MYRFYPVSRVFHPLLSACGLVVLAMTLLAPAAQAAIQWHADLATAQAAAAASTRPVIAVFVAGWTPAADATAPGVLGSPEAEALVSACFEPVRIDVDAHPALTKELGISHVPSVCIIAADDTVLSKFELPGSTPEFVAAAAKAAQAAATHRTTVADQSDLKIRVSPAYQPGSDNAFAARGPASASAAAGAAPATPGSISLVTAKVRELSDFASDEQPTAGSGFRPLPQQSVAAARPPFTPAAPSGSETLPPQPDPSLARSPAGWPTESAPAPLTHSSPAPTQPMPSARPAVEPAASAMAQAAPAAPASPWLGAAPAVTATTPPAAAAPTPEAAEPPKSLSAQFLAAMQKPFTFWSKSPEIPKPSAGAVATPPKMPPALPLPPGAVPGPTAAASTPGQGPADAADLYGSMPLGLEGYCPVTLAEKGQWTEGRAQWGARHRGRTYLFAGEDQQRAFLADPDRYAPALSGDDPVLACDNGTSAPGQRRYGVTYQSRMYLFASPETRSQFAANPNRYVGRVALAETPARSGGTILR